MRSFFKIFAALASVLGLYGCDSFHLDALKPGVSTTQEVLARLGEPAARWPIDSSIDGSINASANAQPGAPAGDGGTIWEYPRGPEGFQCWMLRFDARGVLQGIEQALTEENFARVEKGWSGEQVRRLLGRPASQTHFPLKPEDVWEWRIAPKAPGNNAFFHVHFDMQGRVTGTSRREESPA